MSTDVEADIAASSQRLVDVLRSCRNAAIAFSGGIDSTVVAKAAALALGENAVAVTADSPSVSQGEIDAARALAAAIGIRHVVIVTNEFANAAYRANDGTRCYHCKSELYERVHELRDALHFDVMCSGANLDDLGDFRPGLAAANERGVRHPLQEAGFTKTMVRDVARLWGLPNAEKPATPCLSSRIAIGVEATAERVARIDAAEQALRELGLAICRVRLHPGEHARIETLLTDLPTLLEPTIRAGLVERFKQLGFQFVSLDLEGFRSGSLNVLASIEQLVHARGA